MLVQVPSVAGKDLARKKAVADSTAGRKTDPAHMDPHWPEHFAVEAVGMGAADTAAAAAAPAVDTVLARAAVAARVVGIEVVQAPAAAVVQDKNHSD